MRMPSYSRSHDDWADYLLDNELTVDDAIEKTSSSAVASWLEDERGMIEAIMDSGTAVATFMTKGEIIDSSEETEDDEVLDDDAKGPAKGVRV